jgi:hypothetical protein
MSDSDPLDQFRGMAACPVCGCIDRKGIYRCSECGTFHAGSIMVEREPPTVEELATHEAPALDPSNYSLGPSAAIPDEEFDESDDVRSWDGGSSDFSFDESDEPPVAKIQSLPEPETLNED